MLLPMHIAIRPDRRYQQFEGFGASGAWWAQDVGAWEDEKRNAIINRLFDRQSGIGLTTYRYNIGAGSGDNIADPWRRTETFEVAEGVYDWSRDAAAVWVMKAAQAAGAEQFVAFANSPTARMTRSGLVTGDVAGQTNLLPHMVDQYVQYLIDVTRHLRDDEGVPIGWISPINEPTWPWSEQNGQEGCHFEVDETVVVIRALLDALATSGLDVKVSVIEAADWKLSPQYIAPYCADPLIGRAIDHFAVHSYWSTADDKARVAKFVSDQYSHLPLVMSEWTEMQEGRDCGMDSAIVLANTVHEDLTIANVISWQYWIAVSKYDYRDGLIYVCPETREIQETKRLWALGNFSRFIRPGFVRVDTGVDAAASPLRVSAWSSDGADKVVVVIINAGQTAAPFSLTLPDDLHHLTIHETSAAHDLAPIYAGAPQAAYVAAPQSVTTLVAERR